VHASPVRVKTKFSIENKNENFPVPGQNIINTIRTLSTRVKRRAVNRDRTWSLSLRKFSPATASTNLARHRVRWRSRNYWSVHPHPHPVTHIHSPLAYPSTTRPRRCRRSLPFRQNGRSHPQQTTVHTRLKYTYMCVCVCVNINI